MTINAFLLSAGVGLMFLMDPLFALGVTMLVAGFFLELH